MLTRDEAERLARPITDSSQSCLAVTDLLLSVAAAEREKAIGEAVARLVEMADEHWELNKRIRRDPGYEESGGTGDAAWLEAAYYHELRSAAARIDRLRRPPPAG